MKHSIFTHHLTILSPEEKVPRKSLESIVSRLFKNPEISAKKAWQKVKVTDKLSKEGIIFLAENIIIKRSLLSLS